jgi:RecA-family ATPase
MAQANKTSYLAPYMNGEDHLIEEDPYFIDEPEQDPFLTRMEQTEILDPEAPETPVYKTLSLGEIRDLPEPEWIANGWLQADSFAVLYGAPGSTKSFWALDLSLSIAAGIPFQGNPVKQGQVLMAAGEGLRGLKWRVESWMLAHPEADEQMILDNFRVIPCVPQLLSKDNVAMLLNTAERMAEDEENPLRLVVLDTWARGLVGGDENSQKDAGLAIDACERVRRSTGASILVVHHSGVEGTRERGSTALRGAADTSIMAQRDEVSKVITVTLKKMKDGESGAQSLYSLQQYAHSVVLKPFGGSYTPPQEVRDRDYYARKASEAKRSPF